MPFELLSKQSKKHFAAQDQDVVITSYFADLKAVWNGYKKTELGCPSVVLTLYNATFPKLLSNVITVNWLANT